MFRRDRTYETSTKKIGGGIFICISRHLKAYARPEWNCRSVENIWLTIPHSSLACKERKNLHIGLVYIPPDSEQSDRLETFVSAFRSVTESNVDDYFVVVGDFNLSNINWSAIGPTLLKKGSSKIQIISNIFLNEISNSGLKQHNLIPNSSNNILDLIFSNITLDCVKADSEMVKADTHHPCLKIDVSDLVLSKLHPKPQIRHNFYRANYAEVNKALSQVDWATILVGETMDEVTDNFYNVLNKIVVTTVPKTRDNSSNRFPTWYSRSLIHIIKNKLKAHRRWITFKNPRDYDEFSLLRARQKLVARKCLATYEQNVQQNIIKDPKALWSYLRNKRNCNSSYPSTLTLGDEVFNSESDACEGFNKFFYSVFQPPDLHYDLPQLPESDETYTQVTLSEIEVFKELKALNITKGPGSDGIPAVFLQRCSVWTKGSK
ncbi:unnamed protein product [Leptosia nina]|uniref:Endonuclease/exonuclease/phosphatase domain-containing protein n=1 Tax=Leptosia nina TaxID=320188 RepID=A0AAV1JHM7_9NEOP